MLKIGNLNIESAVLLAPMEDITDISFRLICKELGADIVYTEFVNSEGIIRNSQKTLKKLEIHDEERPIGIQIYGSKIDAMLNAAKISEQYNPDIIDINAGCWVKNVVNCGAGANLIKDPINLQNIVNCIVESVKIPVTVKTRIGWDNNSINIIEIAKRIEDAGAKALTIHCRTRSQGNKGEVDWTWINKVKAEINIPIILNGGVYNAKDVKKAFDETSADAVMIARGAIDNPWIFSEAKELLKFGFVKTNVTEEDRIKLCLKHLKLAIKIKDERRGVIEHRKFYSGYLKGLRNASFIRNELMKFYTYNEIEELLLKYLETLVSYSHFENYQTS